MVPVRREAAEEMGTFVDIEQKHVLERKVPEPTGALPWSEDMTRIAWGMQLRSGSGKERHFSQ